MSLFSKQLKAARTPYTAAVIAAGGSGARFGGDKLMAELSGVPVIVRSLLAFERSALISEIVLVARPDAVDDAAALCGRYGITKLTCVVPGGRTRAESCFAGVMAVSERAELIAVHDGARPLVTDRVIEDAVWGAYRHTAAVPGLPVRDTIKLTRDGLVIGTPDRSDLFAVQTPQCFRREILEAALTDAVRNAPDVTDDCAAVERIGGKALVTAGDEENIKITTLFDLLLGTAILESRVKEGREA